MQTVYHVKKDSMNFHIACQMVVTNASVDKQFEALLAVFDTDKIPTGYCM